MSLTLWQKCVATLQSELPAQQFNTWIRPIQAEGDAAAVRLLAPNRFVQEWVKEHFLPRIETLVKQHSTAFAPAVSLEVRPAMASAPTVSEAVPAALATPEEDLLERALQESTDPVATGSAERRALPRSSAGSRKLSFRGELNPNYTFANFVQGKSNQIARAAAAQVASNLGGAYNPLFIYGGVGLGKTHLMHAIGNHLLQKNPAAKVVYLHSQTFVGSMVSALQLNAINEFKRYYHSVDALLIDDIQFFANKERSQEEFFHTFNAIFEGDGRSS